MQTRTVKQVTNCDGSRCECIHEYEYRLLPGAELMRLGPPEGWAKVSGANVGYFCPKCSEKMALP